MTSRVGSEPPFFVSPITGIFGDYLKAIAAADGRDGLPVDTELAGIATARECYWIVRERGYPVTLLNGGARIPLDLMGMVGADIHATINWSTFAEILEAGTPLKRGIDAPLDPAAIARLKARFPDFRRSLLVDGLAVDEFADFGPVRHFRANFIVGWQQLRATIAEERGRVARGPAVVGG